MNVHIRWMVRPDMSEVLNIEKVSFIHPWSEEDFIRCLRQRNCIGMVAEYDKRVAGFMIYDLHKNKLHVLNFAVAENFRRKTVGHQMVSKLQGKLSKQRRNRLSLEIEERNLAGLQFFKSQGFIATGIRENMITMQFYYEKPELSLENRIQKFAI